MNQLFIFMTTKAHIFVILTFITMIFLNFFGLWNLNVLLSLNFLLIWGIFLSLYSKLIYQINKNAYLKYGSFDFLEIHKLEKDSLFSAGFLISFLPLLFLIIVIRGFIFDYTKIPSESMLPNLKKSDIVLVNKFGDIRNLFNKIPMKNFERGDIVVFKYPVDNSIYFIKRIVGQPGDIIEIKKNKLFINHDEVEQKKIKSENYQYLLNYYDKILLNDLFVEKLNNKRHFLINSSSSVNYSEYFQNNIKEKRGLFQNISIEDCQQAFEYVKCKIPIGYYFMMGDNRGNSEDSRFWGLVSKNNIVGKSDYIMMNTNEFSIHQLFKHIDKI